MGQSRSIWDIWSYSHLVCHIPTNSFIAGLLRVKISQCHQTLLHSLQYMDSNYTFQNKVRNVVTSMDEFMFSQVWKLHNSFLSFCVETTFGFQIFSDNKRSPRWISTPHLQLWKIKFKSQTYLLLNLLGAQLKSRVYHFDP